MKEETLKYKVVVDTSQLPAYLDQIKQQINSAVSQGTVPSYNPDPSMSYTPATYGPVQQAQAQTQSIMNTFQQRYDSVSGAVGNFGTGIQTGYQQFKDYFNPQRNEAANAGPIQLGLGLLGVGYNPYDNLESFGQMSFDYKQRLMDNTTLGAMDYTFGQMVGAGWGVGSAAGWIPGVGLGAGLLAGGVGAVAGAGLWAANEVLSPFASEGTFRRNITRGLRDYGKYSTTGYMDTESRAGVADMVANMDLEPQMVGTHTTRDDVKMMFDTAMGSDYIRTSTDATDLKEKMRAFMESYTKIQHLIGKTGKDVADFVDTLQNVGLTDQFGGDLFGASNFLQSSSLAARLTVDQGTQLFQGGASMFRGTGFSLAASGELALNTLANVNNMLKYGELKQSDVDQFGGTVAASQQLVQDQYANASSGMGHAIGMGMAQGNFQTGMNQSAAFMSGMGGVRSWGDYIKRTEDYNRIMSTNGGAEAISMADVATNINTLKQFGKIQSNSSFEDIANTYSMTFGVPLADARMLVANTTRSPESIAKGLNDTLYGMQRNDMFEHTSWAMNVEDNVRNLWTGVKRWFGSAITVPNNELQYSWGESGLNAPLYKDVKETFQIGEDKDYTSLDTEYKNLSDKDKVSVDNLNIKNKEDLTRYTQEYAGNPGMLKNILMKGRRMNLLQNSSSNMDRLNNFEASPWKALSSETQSDFSNWSDWSLNPNHDRSLIERLGFSEGITDFSSLRDNRILEYYHDLDKGNGSDMVRDVSNMYTLLSQQNMNTMGVVSTPEDANRTDTLWNQYKNTINAGTWEEIVPIISTIKNKYGEKAASQFVAMANKQADPNSLIRKSGTIKGVNSVTENLGDVEKDLNYNITHHYLIAKNIETPEFTKMMDDPEEMRRWEKDHGYDKTASWYLEQSVKKGNEIRQNSVMLQRSRTNGGLIFDSLEELRGISKDPHYKDVQDYIETKEKDNDTFTLEGYKKLMVEHPELAKKLSRGNLANISEDQFDIATLTTSNMSPALQRKSLQDWSANVASEIATAGQLRTQVAPDGSVTQSVDKDGLQKASADALTSIMMSSKKQTSVQTALLHATISTMKDAGLRKTEWEAANAANIFNGNTQESW